MDTEKNDVDVSYFLIFEATGDSEADHFVDPNKATGGRGGDDSNDAESCSHDGGDNFPCVEKNNVVNGRFWGNNVQVCIDDDDKEEEGEEAHSYYPTWPHEHHKNSGHKNSVDSSHDEELIMSEMEKNKLFWETCLAS